jgi:hypothetical protein
VIDKVSRLNNGIYLGKLHIDILLYADDIVLISSGKKKLQQMLDVVTEFGESNEVKFNGAKTTLLLFNKSSRKLTTFERLQENRIQLSLAGEKIVADTKMKYLGVWFKTNYSSVIHIENRHTQTINKMALLERIGFNTKSTDVNTKSLIFKSFIRPIIQYGCDSLCLTSNDIINLNRLEANVIKDSFNLFRRIKTTQLFNALRIQTPKDNLVKSKLSLFLRLIDNEFTLDVINNVIEESKTSLIGNSLLNEIISIIKSNELDNTIESIKNHVMIKLNEINSLKKYHESSTELVNEIRIELNKRVINTTKIEELLSAFIPNIYSDYESYDSDY